MSLEKVNILLIEDDPEDADLLQEILFEKNPGAFKVQWVDKLQIGLERLNQEVDVILLDLSLPDSYGMETFQRVDAHAPRVPIVVLSGLDDETMAVRAVQEGAQDYLVKGEIESDLLARSLRYAIKRKQAEVALRDSKERFRKIFEEGPLGMAMLDSDYRFVDVNTRLGQMLGYTEQELTKLTLANVTHSEDVEKVLQLVQQVFEGDVLYDNIEKRFLTKMDETLWINFTASTIRDEDGRLRYGLAMVEDITERKRTEAALRESEERYALAARGANDGLWDWDLKTNKIYFSPRWKSMLGYNGHNRIRSKPDEWFKRVHPEDRNRLQLAVDAHLQGQTPHFEDEYRIRHKDGSYRWVLCRGVSVRDTLGQPYRMAGSQTDITRRKKAEEQLRHDALHDALTGLPNRTLFMGYLEQAIKQAEQDKEYLFAVLFLDLDRFKVINDSLGHLIGDQLLTVVARRLDASVRPNDTVARLGGDEFVVLLDSIKDVNEARQIANRIQHHLAQPIKLGRHKVFATASIGITTSIGNYERPEELLRDADTAMYQAKELGKARYEFFNTGQHTQAVARWQLEADMWRAVEQQEFVIHYQPFVASANGRITGVEALLRWQHPQRGLISPETFIPLAEETGLIARLGEWALRAACIQLKRWHAAGHSALRLAINVSPRQFWDQNLPDLVKTVLAENELSGQFLELEITERVNLKNRETNVEILSTLRAMGLRISIDDFGLSSSLDCLKRLPLDTLKIGQSFVKDMNSDGQDTAIITAIIAMAHSLNLNVVAEGVETKEHLVFLRTQQCDEIQGHLVSEPVPVNAVAKLLQKKRHLPKMLK